MTSIETRVERVHRALLLIVASAHGCGEDSPVTPREIIAAIEDTALEVIERSATIARGA
jgi:hypothetical protein